MAASRKKVIVRRLTGETLAGYLPATGMVRNLETLELLDLAGRVVPIALNEIKLVSYVREFNLADSVNPERMSRWTFLARPRNEGLWIRLTLHSGEFIEGLAAADVRLMDGIAEDAGLHLTPPDTRSNTQHFYIPRAAIAEITILAVIKTASRPKLAHAPRAETSDRSLQEELFESALPPSSRPN